MAVLAVTVIVAALLSPGPLSATRPAPARDFIVILRDTASVSSKVRDEESRGNEVSDVFKGRFKGFVASLDRDDVRRLRGDAGVLIVEPDSLVSVGAFATPETDVSDVSTPGEEIPGEYIVTLRDGVAPTMFAAVQADDGALILDTYEAAINGFAARLTPAQVTRLGNDPLVTLIEPNAIVGIAADQSTPPSWGLDRIDQRMSTLDRTYTHDFTGAGVRAYIIDTGVRSDHVDFGGRVSSGYTAILDDGGTEDCNGHGTHVAGTVGGQAHGVAKAVTIVPVRVLRCSGSGSISGVIAGVDWMINDHPVGAPAVANISISGGQSSSLNRAVANAVRDGITVVVAAGNVNSNAAGSSPASEPLAITVGATAINDTRASFSNFGPVLDLFAPGVGIVSADDASTTATATLSGTSMAAPHVAGAAALLLDENPGLSPAQVVAHLTSCASRGVVGNAGVGSPNLLLFSRAPWTAPPGGVPGAPCSLVVEVEVDRAVLSWNPPTQGGTGGVIDYVVEFSLDDVRNWVTFNDGVSTASSATVTGLTSGDTYAFRVGARNSAGDGPTGDVVVTTIGAPSAPLDLSGTSGSGRVTLSWNSPNHVGGAAISDYVVEYKASANSAWTTFADDVSTSTSATVTGLVNDVSYDFRVRAVNSFGSGEASAPVTAVPRLVSPPSHPRNAVVSAVMLTSIAIQWQVPSSSGGSSISRYLVEQSVDNGATWAASMIGAVTEPSASVRATVVTSLVTQTEYRFRVRAENSSGISEPSAATPSRAPGVPSQPLNIRVTGTGLRSATLAWDRPLSDGGSSFVSYTIDYSVNSGATWVAWPAAVDVVGCDCPTLTRTVTDLVAGLPHVFRVRAANSVASGPASAATSPAVTPLAPVVITPPDAPRDVRAVAADQSATVYWRPPVDDGGGAISGYVVTANPGDRSCTTTGELRCSIAALSNGTSYAFTVVATNSAGVGGASTVSVTPGSQSGSGLLTLSWGIDRLDQRSLPLDDRIERSELGAGVTVYVVDTGVRATHSEFVGRVAIGFSGISDGGGTSDCHGHGTHVAGTIAGTNFGLAPAATIVPVRVLDCDGLGTVSDVIAGIDWMIDHHSSDVPAVANLSFVGARSQALDLAVARGVADGITFVAAAGNDDASACSVSPAGEPLAITVGATTQTDVRWSASGVGSNFGSCLDVFAPGTQIVSAGFADDVSTRTLTGTSMAAPHVAGVAALALSRNPALTPAAVADLITSTATRDVVSNAGIGSPNRLVYSTLELYPTDGGDGGGDGSGGGDGGGSSDGGGGSGGGPADPPPTVTVPTTTAPVPVTPTTVDGVASRQPVPAPGVRPARGTPVPGLPASVRPLAATVRSAGRTIRIAVNAPIGSLVHVYRSGRLINSYTRQQARNISIPAKGADPDDVVIVVVARSGRVSSWSR